MSNASPPYFRSNATPFDQLAQRWLSGMGPLGRQPAAVLLLLTVLQVLLIGYLDLRMYMDPAVPPELSLSLFYLAPIVLAAWFVGGRVGVGIALLSAAVNMLQPQIALLLTGFSPKGSAPAPVVYWNFAVLLGTFLFVVLMVTTLRRMLARERALARVDDLTGVANRRSFTEVCDQEIRRAGRYQRPFSVAYMDIDDFKVVNDRFGHDGGDQVLTSVARTMRDSVRTTDIVARLGGDEFAILLPETGPEAAQVTLQRLRQQLVTLAAQQNWPVSPSIGLVTYRTPPPSLEHLLRTVDAVMYSVKREGKNQLRHEVVDGSPSP